MIWDGDGVAHLDGVRRIRILASSGLLSSVMIIFFSTLSFLSVMILWFAFRRIHAVFQSFLFGWILHVFMNLSFIPYLFPGFLPVFLFIFYFLFFDRLDIILMQKKQCLLSFLLIILSVFRFHCPWNSPIAFSRWGTSSAACLLHPIQRFSGVDFWNSLDCCKFILDELS